jgi:hypothetical protein
MVATVEALMFSSSSPPALAPLSESSYPFMQLKFTATCVLFSAELAYICLDHRSVNLDTVSLG